MNSEIHAWLTGDRDFDLGLALFYKYTSSRSVGVVRVLEGKRSRYSADKLAWELEKLLGTAVIVHDTNVVNIIEERPGPPVDATFHGVVISEQAGVVFAELQEKKRALYKEATFLQQTALWKHTPENDRAKAAVRIIEIMEQLLPEIWGVLDEMRETGKVPEGYGKPQEIAPAFKLEGMSVVKLVQRRANIRTYLSRDKDNALKAEKVKSWTAEIDAINKILGDE